jgi:hypothetical protein
MMFDTSPQLDCNGRVLKLDLPRVMGIVNVTPDSFADGGEHATVEAPQVDAIMEAANRHRRWTGTRTAPHATNPSRWSSAGLRSRPEPRVRDQIRKKDGFGRPLCRRRRVVVVWPRRIHDTAHGHRLPVAGVSTDERTRRIPG